VPLITPVEVLRESPVGRLGDTLYETGVPVTVGESGVIAESFANTFGDVYDNALGAVSFTVMVITKFVLPPVFVAVIVYVERFATTVGVPEIIPVDVSNVRPAGKSGRTVYETGVPVIVGDSGVIDVPFVYIFGDKYERLVGAMSLTVITTPKVVLPPVLVAIIV
jgi:hypothetical protein